MLKDQFVNLASTLNTQERYGCSSRPPSLPYYYRHHLYPIGQLSVLIKALKQAKQDHDERIIKYVVTPKKRLLFALEGPPGTFVPSHKEMVPALMKPTVLAAGYLFLDQDGQIIGISNQSHDFNLPIKSLLWTVSILHIMETSIHDHFNVISNEGDYFQLHPEDRTSIIAQLPLHIFKTLLQANQQNSVIIREAPFSKTKEAFFSSSPYFTEIPIEEFFNASLPLEI